MQGYDETASEFSGLVSAIIDDENCDFLPIIFPNRCCWNNEEGWPDICGRRCFGSDLYGQMTDYSMLEDVTVTSPRESMVILKR